MRIRMARVSTIPEGCKTQDIGTKRASAAKSTRGWGKIEGSRLTPRGLRRIEKL
jgi:hypothetical protein